MSDGKQTKQQRDHHNKELSSVLHWGKEKNLSGWGRFPKIPVSSLSPQQRDEVFGGLEDVKRQGDSVLGVGLGRSYGDSGLPVTGSRALKMTSLTNVIAFDSESGWIECEAGVSIYQLIQHFLPLGFFPPVVPGTQFVTLGGALCNDIHGKNHHQDGTFADHVRDVEVLTANGEVIVCDAEQNSEFFWATVGGLGLTGMILSLKLKLTRVGGPGIEMESIRVRDLDHFFEVSAESGSFTHTVSWIDCVAQGAQLGRGIFMRGRHSHDQPKPRLLGRVAASISPLLKVPFSMPNWLLNPLTIRTFNELYFRKHPQGLLSQTTHYEPFFFPLDFVRDWNRIYGGRGFLQYQLVVPNEPDHRAIRTILEEISKTGMGSFLAVIKEFGHLQHGGLSFPRPGVTLALDFPHYGQPLFELFNRLDRIVMDVGGRVYLGKDARLPKEHFQEMYPEWQEWLEVKEKWDPQGLFRSTMSERLGLT